MDENELSSEDLTVLRAMFLHEQASAAHAESESRNQAAGMLPEGSRARFDLLCEAMPHTRLLVAYCGQIHQMTGVNLLADPMGDPA